MINNDAMATTAPPTTPTPLGMDYAFLRKTGIEHIQRLAGELWTDHNTHDPGITLLECLCYAITDVSYRLSFEMKDLLAVLPTHGSNPSNISRAPLFTARDILTSHPVTLNDYRKLLIDIPGVRNAWIEKNPASLVPIYYEAQSNCLRLNQATETAKPLPLRGIYQVYIAKDDTVSDGKKEQALMKTVKARLHQYRQIAEDFADPILLPFEEITVKLHIVVADDVDLDRLAAHIYWQLSQAIAPTLSFHSLSARRQENRPIDTIFEGPPLANGFIDETELEGFDRKTTLRSSDFIHIILDMDGVQSVKKIALESSQKSGFHQPWVLELDLNYTPKLKPLQQLLESDLQFERQGILCQINIEAAKAHLKNVKEREAFDKKKQPLQDIPLPRGHYRHLGDYVSIQHDLPPNYGIGSLGLPDSVSPTRKIQAKQLKAYLLFFDQLLANYLAQLAHIRELFCPPIIGDTAPRSIQTYFTQSVTDVPELDSVLNPDHKTHLQQAIENVDTKITRENKLLNHLMARFGEQFIDDALLLYDKQQQRKPVISLGENKAPWQGFHLEDKLAFLQAYPQMSAARGSAFNYTQKRGDTDNIAGLKRRLCGLLGIQAVNTATINDEGFHLVEHVLLRPRSTPSTEPYWAFLGSPIVNFSESAPTRIARFSKSAPNRTVCHVPDHDLQAGDHITISNTTHYNGRYEIKWTAKDSFHIEKPFVAEEANQGKWTFPNSTLAPTRIARFSKSAPNRTVCHVPDHDLQAGDHITISNTTHYNGRYEIKWTAKDSFHIEKPFVAEEVNQGKWTFPNSTFCHASDHGLQKGDHITVSDTGHYKGNYEIKWKDKDYFCIEKPFVAEEANQAQWAMDIHGKDPYSLQLSFIFPAASKRFKEKNFKKLLCDVLINEVPAHLVIYVHWFNYKAMCAFEEVYQAWLTKMATDPTSAWQESVQLLALLRMGKALT
ncbi:hypothetical protein [Candidatus Regiella endosymbiont of Tuberolachnus salignus]|uniref:hypothetical protein n=1 Tax=Candidatus Regiella endosymbiont of Tuberolachnus salignus TaxID=3077956 RepID=UPI0030D16041